MEEIDADGASESLGPYSDAIRSGDRIYVSGKGPEDPETGEIPADVGAQTTAALRNVETILEGAGTSADAIVNATVYLTDMDDYEAVNDAYGAFLNEPYPARTCVEVSRLPAPIDVEISVIAEANEER